MVMMGLRAGWLGCGVFIFDVLMIMIMAVLYSFGGWVREPEPFFSNHLWFVRLSARFYPVQKWLSLSFDPSLN